jgi:uncharacterized protein YbbC (DUF1343 family)
MATGSWAILAATAPFLFSLRPWRGPDEPGARTGLEVIVAEDFKPLHGKTIGLITNHTGSDRQGRHIVDLFLRAKGVRVAALFGPEHGIRGRSEGGAKIATQSDSASGLTIYSLYGATRKPSPEMLHGLDALVFDMQDAGARFYTYISTMSLAMEAAAEADIDFYVLDRPNPIGGRVEGPVLEEEHRSFVGIHPVALRHGMTIGELAQMFLGEGWILPRGDLNHSGKPPQTPWAKLRIIRMQNWRHSLLFSETGLPWIAPSPNMTSLQAALLYPGVALLEATNFSEGRGTVRPFEVIGAPWLDPARLMAELQHVMPGIVLEATRFTPVAIPGKVMNPKFENQECPGLALAVTEPHRFETVKFGVALLCALHKIHPDEFAINQNGLARLSVPAGCTI